MSGPIAVLNTGAGSVSFIDPLGLSVDGAVLVGEAPKDMAEARAHHTLFVSVAGDGTVAIIDVASRRLVGRTKVGEAPCHIYEHPSGKEIWVANDGSGDLSVLAAASGEKLATVPAGAGHHKIAFTSDGRWAFATNITDGTVTVVDGLSHDFANTIPVVNAPHGIAVTPDDRHVLISNVGADVVSVIDVGKLEVAKDVRGPFGPNYIRLSPDKACAWIAHKSGMVSRFDVARLEFDGSVALGETPERMAIAADGRRIFVNDMASAVVSVIDAVRLEVVAEIPVEASGGHQNLVLGPPVGANGGALFAVNHGAGTVSVIDTGAHRVISNLGGGDGPSAIVALGDAGDH